MVTQYTSTRVTDGQRAILGFALGFVTMLAATHVFLVNSFDFENMQRGVRLLMAGVNPWDVATRIPNYYNPPHSIVFLWPMLITSPRLLLSVGTACLFAFTFYQRTWVALAWFATNTALWVIAAGGIDMLLIGGGLLLLIAGDRTYATKRGLALRVLAYGILLVKPQGGLFVAVLYVLSRRDWKGAGFSVLLFVLPFLPLYPSWIRVILLDPPLGQTEAAHTLWQAFGFPVAALIALGALTARKWQYWELGGALAGSLAPYGMVGIPSFLALTAVKSPKAIPVVVIWSAALAAITWVAPPEGVDYYDYLQPFMTVFHLSMFGLALTLACLAPDAEGSNLIAVSALVRRIMAQLSRERAG